MHALFLVLSTLGLLGGFVYAQGSFSRISVAPSISPRNGHTKGGAVGTYLERGCVHACTQMYTREYTMVYTRVHFSLLGSRYMLGAYRLSIEVFLSLEWTS